MSNLNSSDANTAEAAVSHRSTQDTATIAYLTEQLQIAQAHNQHLETQLHWLQQQLENRDRANRERDNLPNQPLNLSPDAFQTYSGVVRLGFRALKWLFLFLMGFSVACVLSASLQAQSVLTVLMGLVSMTLVPLVLLTLCILLGVAILESLK